MAANTGEDHVDDPAIPPTPIPLAEGTTPGAGEDEIIQTNTPEIINPTPETNNMEVHHHTHAGHGKKTWKSYFWEFLMLFLAVFCGFLAEYQLEHIIEHNREKQFIRSYIEDLKMDTVSVSRFLSRRKTTIEKLDSLMQLLGGKKIKGHENELYYFGRLLTRNVVFQANDRTIIQLKNSGSLRLIRNEQAADSIMSYQKMIDFIDGVQEREKNERFGTYPILSRMFDPFVFDTMFDIHSNNFNRPATNPPLRSYDENIQLDLAFSVHQLKSSSYLLTTQIQRLYPKASNIISFLKAEYHIE